MAFLLSPIGSETQPCIVEDTYIYRSLAEHPPRYRLARSSVPHAPGRPSLQAMALAGPNIEFSNARDLSYSEVSCVTILTWDVLIMLSEEVRQGSSHRRHSLTM